MRYFVFFDKLLYLSIRFFVVISILFLAGHLSAWRMYWSTLGSGGGSDGVDVVLEGESVSMAGGFGELSDMTIGQAVIGNIGAITDCSNIGFWYKSMPALLDFSISNEIWEIDSIFAHETETMDERDRIVIENSGNFYLDLGLCYVGSDSADWSITAVPGADILTIRARFTGDDRAPFVFNASDDFIDDEIKWAGEDAFGEYGKGIPPQRQSRLWLQFHAPLYSSHWGENTVTITIHGQYHLP